MRYPIEPLTGDEVIALIKQCKKSCPTGIRNRAMIAVMYRCGARVGEVLKLRQCDLDMDAGSVRLLWCKGAKQRVVGIDGVALAVVQRWVDVRDKAGIGGHSPLFCTLKGGRMQESYVRALMTRIGKQAGIVKRVHAHGLRHTFAVEACQEGVPVPILQRQLGHSSLATTDIYLSHLLPTEVIERIHRREWKGVRV